MRDVIAYTTIGELLSSPVYESIRDLPHIAMSRSLRRHLRQISAFEHVTTLQDILGTIAPHWKTDETQMDELSEISRLIRIKKEQASGDDRVWLDGCMKQAYRIWSSITMLEEADARPGDLEPCNRNQELMVDLWASLEKTSTAIREIRAVQPTEDVMARLARTIHSISESSENRIIVHGFYYITPIQERLLRIFEEAGFRLTFLFQYDSNYPMANEVWRMMYNGSFGFPDEGDWFKIGMSVKNDFGEILNGNTIDSERFHLIEYRTVSEFVNDSSLMEGGVELFSPDQKTANGLLKEFHPEKYGKRPLISYPVGGFIDALHRMWDADSDCVMLDVETLSQCFAYGWITYEGRRSTAYMQDFQKISTFFRGCSTIRDWWERLGLLREIQSQAVDVFRMGDDDRWAEFMGNPLLNFAPFSLEDGGRAVIALIEKLIQCVTELFGDGHASNVKDHMGRLTEILNGEIIDSDSMKKEMDIAVRAIERITSADNRTSFMPADLSNAVTVYLRNEFVVQEDGLDSYGDLVRPMHGLDATSSDDIRILLSDMVNLPGGGPDYIWPLNRECIDRLEKQQGSKDIRPLTMFVRFIRDSAIAANRHLLYSASWARDVTISWIREIDGKMHAPSPYIEMICGTGCTNIDHIPYSRSTKQRTDLIVEAVPKLKTFVVRGKGFPEDAMYDLMLCPYRFVYSFVLERYPTIIGEFQQGFAASGLISALNALQTKGGFSKPSIESNVMELFPNLTDVEKREILDHVFRSREGGSTRHGDRSYTDLRFAVRFPQPLRTILDQKRSEFNVGASVEITHTAEESKTCMYCPHSYHCRHARFKVDDRE